MFCIYKSFYNLLQIFHLKNLLANFFTNLFTNSLNRLNKEVELKQNSILLQKCATINFTAMKSLIKSN